MIFSKIDVNKVEWLNLVFENRNQSYGAYVLRRDSGNYLFKSLLITGFLFGGAVLFSAVIKNVNSDSVAVVTNPLVNPDVVRIIPVDIVKSQVEQSTSVVSASKSVDKTNLQTVKLSGNLTPTREKAAVVELPTLKQIDESVISSQDQSGLAFSGSNGGRSITNSGEGMGGVGNSGTEIYGTELLEAMPEFPGGMSAWAKFLNKNLHYPVAAIDNGVAGKVLVSFVVEKNGEVSNLKVIKGIGGGCDEEAMRVIKKSPFWKPGMQNGRKVRVAYIMPVVFRME